MSDLTRKQIEEARGLGRDRLTNSEWLQLCDMALRTLDAEDRAQAAQENWSLEVEHLGERLEQAEARIRELEPALRAVLPMAKGYAHEHPVGANQEICNDAERLLAATAPPESEPAEGEGDGVIHEAAPISPAAWEAAGSVTPPQRRDALEAEEALNRIIMDGVNTATGMIRATERDERIVRGFIQRSALSAGVPESVYQSAVKGRADFRAALRQERDKLKAVRRLPDKWLDAADWYERKWREQEGRGCYHAQASTIRMLADELDRALAQHREKNHEG